MQFLADRMWIFSSTSLLYASLSLPDRRHASEIGAQLEHSSRCFDDKIFCFVFIFPLSPKRFHWSIVRSVQNTHGHIPLALRILYSLFFTRHDKVSVTLLTSCPFSIKRSQPRKSIVILKNNFHLKFCGKRLDVLGDLCEKNRSTTLVLRASARICEFALFEYTIICHMDETTASPVNPTPLKRSYVLAKAPATTC